MVDGKYLEVDLVPRTAPTTIATMVATRNNRDRINVDFLRPSIVPGVLPFVGLEYWFVDPETYSLFGVAAHCCVCGGLFVYTGDVLS